MKVIQKSTGRVGEKVARHEDYAEPMNEIRMEDGRTALLKDSEIEQVVAGRAFTQKQMEVAFDLVRDPADWRAPIDFRGELHPEDVEAACEAIRFFTATEPTLQELTTGEVRIKAAGYRMGPAGP